MSVFRGAPSTVTRPDLFPRSAEQAAVLKQVRAGSLWTDPDFSPTDASLHGKGKPRPPSMAAVVAWLRPDEFAPLPAGSTHALIVGDAAAGDVVQGALGDCYLLGALSTVAASRHKGRSRLLQLVMPADGVSHEDPPEGKAQGAYTFRFYIFGEWVQVTVDTLIPCGADRRPVFARCHDERELWALYLEKAYAKLHGSYRAIEGGSLTAALVDLTGGFAAEIDLRTPATAAELESGRLWQRLMRYQKLGYLMGAAVSVPGGETEAKTEHNLMQNHAYGLLLHYEQKLGAVPGVPLRLVKLRNPWGHGEWNGAWADGSAEWRSAPGEYAAEQLDYTPENDGTFFIEFTQYARAMNTVYVCKVLPDDEWHRSVISDGWAASAGTAGGCFNFPTWRVNPQWQLRLDVASHAHFVMLQPDARVPHDAARGARASPPAAASQAQEHAIGLYVMRGHERFLRRVLVNSDEIDGEEIVDSTAFVAAREVSCNTLDEEGELPLAPGVPYVLVPSTFLPGADGQFKVVIYTHTPPATLEKIPPLLCAQAHGAWRGPTAGGPRDRLSWKRNPQFFVHARSAQPTRISIVLHREDLSAHRLDEGAKGSRRAAPSEPQSPAADARVGGGPHEQPAPRSAARFGSEIGFVVAYAESSSAALSGHRALHVRKADLVDTAQCAHTGTCVCVGARRPRALRSPQSAPRASAGTRPSPKLRASSCSRRRGLSWSYRRQALQGWRAILAYPCTLTSPSSSRQWRSGGAWRRRASGRGARRAAVVTRRRGSPTRSTPCRPTRARAAAARTAPSCATSSSRSRCPTSRRVAFAARRPRATTRPRRQRPRSRRRARTMVRVRSSTRASDSMCSRTMAAS